MILLITPSHLIAHSTVTLGYWLQATKHIVKFNTHVVGLTPKVLNLLNIAEFTVRGLAAQITSSVSAAHSNRLVRHSATLAGCQRCNWQLQCWPKPRDVGLTQLSCWSPSTCAVQCTDSTPLLQLIHITLLLYCDYIVFTGTIALWLYSILHSNTQYLIEKHITIAYHTSVCAFC